MCLHTHHTQRPVSTEKGTHMGIFLFFSLQTHPMRAPFFCDCGNRAVFRCVRSCSTNMTPGGACVLCNLSPIVLMSNLGLGTGFNYVVTQSYLVNHLPLQKLRHKLRVC